MIQNSARIILVNRDLDVLLLLYENKVPIDPLRPDMLNYWVTPGGALETGESFEQAALRELEEETGIQVDIGPWVWTRYRTLRRNGSLLQHVERYFVAHLNDGPITTRNRTTEDIVASRWWSSDEMRNSSANFLPPDLPSLVQPILEGRYPSKPVLVDTDVDSPPQSWG
jgi:8-oxo-dGTP pyrophosphatase MutT (NUDIX family)